jgi:hypothetical protein
MELAMKLGEYYLSPFRVGCITVIIFCINEQMHALNLNKLPHGIFITKRFQGFLHLCHIGHTGIYLKSIQFINALFYLFLLMHVSCDIKRSFSPGIIIASNKVQQISDILKHFGDHMT